MSDKAEETTPHKLFSKPPSTLLVGPPGTGKTTSLVTYIRAGLKLGVHITDPGGEEALIMAMRMYDLPMDMLHYSYIPPASPAFETLLSAAKRVNMTSYEDITKIKTGIGKSDYQQFMQLLEGMSDFKCDRTGKSLGAVDDWDSEWAYATDSLSGINVMAMDLTIGAKPAAHQGEWGVAMNMEEKLLTKLTSDLKCFFCLTAHLERELDEIAGSVKLMAGALGRKLAPKIPRNFSDVVTSYRESDKFFWSTIMNNVDLKARTLPLRDKLDPDFGQIVEGWRERVSAAQPTAKS